MIKAGKGLMGSGHRVTIACLPDSVIEKRALEASLATWSFTIPVDIALWKIPVIQKYLKKNQVDVLICCQNKDVRIGGRAAKKAGTKAIFARQGIQNLTNKNKYIKPFTKYIDGIITNTKSIKEIYEGFGWFPEDFIHVVYNGVEVNEHKNKIDLYKKYNLPKNSQIIFSAGRLDEQKGFDLLIKVAAKARESDLDWQILVAGEGKYREALEEQAENENVADRFHLIGFEKDIASLNSSCDIFVLPSRYEGMPNALLEAMAVGKANVATAVNGAPELVIDGKTGYLVESENVEQIFEKTRAILEDDKLRASMGKASLERVKKDFSMSALNSNLEMLFKSQLNKGQ